MKLPQVDSALRPRSRAKVISASLAVTLAAVVGMQSCGTRNGATVSKVPGTTDSGNGDVVADGGESPGVQKVDPVKKDVPVNPQSFGRPTLLGKHLLADKGLFFGPRASVKIYTEQAESGDVDAMARVAVCHYLGRGTTVDYGAALQWFQKAAEQNDKKSQFALGYMYENGEGTDKKQLEALRWYMKGAEGHGPYAELSQEQVDRLSKEMRPEDVERIRQEVVDWYNMSDNRKRNVDKLRRPY